MKMIALLISVVSARTCTTNSNCIDGNTLKVTAECCGVKFQKPNPSSSQTAYYNECFLQSLNGVY